MPRTITAEILAEISKLAKFMQDLSKSSDDTVVVLAELDAERAVSKALAEALSKITNHIEQSARDSYLEDKDVDPELFEATYEDVDIVEFLAVKDARAALALYAAQKEKS